MLIVALVLAVIGLAALVTSVVTGNELIAWVCIGASALGVLLLIVDAIRDRGRRQAVVPAVAAGETTEVIQPVADAAFEEPDEFPTATDESEIEAGIEVEDYPDEIVHDEPEDDLPSDDELEFPEPAEEAAVHVVSEDYLAAEQRADEEYLDAEIPDQIPAQIPGAVENVGFTYVETEIPPATYTYVQTAETVTEDQ